MLFSVGSVSGCTVTFTNNTRNAVGYDWNFDDGSLHDSSKVPPPHKFPGNGDYFVELKAWNSKGVTDSNTIKVPVTCP